MVKKTGMPGVIIIFYIIIYAAIPVSGNSDVDIHGFISQGYMQSDHNKLFYFDTEDGTFEFDEIGINFMTHLPGGLQLGMQLFAGDLGSYGNNELIVDWAYADYFYKKWLGIRAGKMKIYHGLYNDTRDIDMLRVNIFLPQCTYPEMFRDVFSGLKGIGVYGEMPLGLTYQFATGVNDIKKNSAFTFIFKRFFLTDVEQFRVENYTNGSLVWETPITGLRISSTILSINLEGEGEHVFAHTDSTIDMKYSAYTASVELILGNLILCSEYNRMKLLYDVKSSTKGAGDNLITGGYYVGGSYSVNKQIEVGAYYSILYFDMDEKEDATFLGFDIGNDSHMKELVFSLKMNINDNWTAKCELHSNEGHYLSEAGDDGKSYKNWFLWAMKMTYSF